MMKEICATLLTLCSTLLQSFDFEYSTDKQKLFVRGIAECTIVVNTSVPPAKRVPVLISTAQAILESNWGKVVLPEKPIIFMALFKLTRPNLILSH